ncbi:MAG: FG-GAP repeat protein, partial [Deltaproteobacteria bacterium]|nr:FG-GAP repeat protein [Deltaproteobacteria bacterium]
MIRTLMLMVWLASTVTACARLGFDPAKRDAGAMDGATEDSATVDGAMDGATVDGATVDGATVDGATVDGATVDGATVDGAPADGDTQDASTVADATQDAPTPMDATQDAPAAVDAPTDNTVDTQVDRGLPDAPPPDLNPPTLPASAQARSPVNGFTTGSIHVPLVASIVDHPLRPKLTWEPAAGATTYQIQMTSECATASFRSCAFTATMVDEQTANTAYQPEGALPIRTAAPVGRRYYWRVRACNSAGCSAFTAVRYLDVGRHSDDFNGDGYADVVIVAPYQDNPQSDEGTAYVYLGSATGPAASPDITLDNPLDQVGGTFGTSVASVGDVNGDGFADLMVGASFQDHPASDEGTAYVYLGSATGPATSPDISFDNPLDQAGGRFG